MDNLLSKYSPISSCSLTPTCTLTDSVEYMLVLVYKVFLIRCIQSVLPVMNPVNSALLVERLCCLATLYRTAVPMDIIGVSDQ